MSEHNYERFIKCFLEEFRKAILEDKEIQKILKEEKAKKE